MQQATQIKADTEKTMENIKPAGLCCIKNETSYEVSFFDAALYGQTLLFPRIFGRIVHRKYLMEEACGRGFLCYRLQKKILVGK